MNSYLDLMTSNYTYNFYIIKYIDDIIFLVEG